MAKIHLHDIRHSYLDQPSTEADWALKRIDIEWDDGGAYALLGPSGCGKSTLLNIVSGLVNPTEGQVLFDDREGVSPGVRFKDAELIGVPTIVVCGRGVADEDAPTVEVKDRRSGERQDVPLAGAAEHIVELCQA